MKIVNQYSHKLLFFFGFMGMMTALPVWVQKITIASNFTTLDPYDANDTLSQAVVKSFYQGLFGFDEEMKLKSVLAESYYVSPDGLSYTIKLKRSIKFRDGTLFDAAR